MASKQRRRRSSSASSSGSGSSVSGGSRRSRDAVSVSLASMRSQGGTSTRSTESVLEDPIVSYLQVHDLLALAEKDPRGVEHRAPDVIEFVEQNLDEDNGMQALAVLTALELLFQRFSSVKSSYLEDTNRLLRVIMEKVLRTMSDVYAENISKDNALTIIELFRAIAALNVELVVPHVPALIPYVKRKKAGLAVLQICSLVAVAHPDAIFTHVEKLRDAALARHRFIEPVCEIFAKIGGASMRYAGTVVQYLMAMFTATTHNADCLHAVLIIGKRTSNVLEPHVPALKATSTDSRVPELSRQIAKRILSVYAAENPGDPEDLDIDELNLGARVAAKSFASLKKFVRRNAASLRTYSDLLRTLQLPIPTRFSFGKAGTRVMKAEFTCSLQYTSCTFPRMAPFTTTITSMWQEWLKVAFVVGRLGQTTISGATPDAPTLYDLMATSKDPPFLQYIASPFLTRTEIAELVDSLAASTQYFEDFSFIADTAEWGCSNCTAPVSLERASVSAARAPRMRDIGLPHSGSLVYKPGAFKKPRTYWFVLNSSGLYYAESEDTAAKAELLVGARDIMGVRMAAGDPSRDARVSMMFEVMVNGAKAPLLFTAPTKSEAEDWVGVMDVAFA